MRFVKRLPYGSKGVTIQSVSEKRNENSESKEKDYMEHVTEKIINIGVNDRSVTLFEGQYAVKHGMAYNSYVILDEKTAVMDTVDGRVTDDWLAGLELALNGKSVDYLVVQHMEPDHSGSVQELADRFPQMKIVASASAFQMMKQFFEIDLEGRMLVVKEGDTLELGAHTLQFYTAPMVHWPEVIVTYEKTERIVFSADGFGKFGTRDTAEDWTCEARRYYINICGKYGPQVQALLKKLATLDVAVICPLHGPVLTENLAYYIGKYDIWSRYEPEDKGILIAFASVYGHTREAVMKLKEILETKSRVKVKVCDLCREDPHEAIENAFRYDRLVLAAISYDASVFPAMDDFLRHLKGKNFQNRTVALIENGSWGPTAGKAMKALLGEMKEITILDPMITIRSAIKPETVTQLEELADTLLKH